MKKFIFVLAAFFALASFPRESSAGACMTPSNYDPINTHSVIFKGKFIGYEPLSFLDEIQLLFGKDFSQDKDKTMHMVVETDFKGNIKGKDVYLRKGSQGTIDYMRPLIQGHDYIIYTDENYTLHRCGSEWIDLTTIGPHPPYDYSHLIAYKEKRDREERAGTKLQNETPIDLGKCSPQDAKCINDLAFLYESGSGNHKVDIDKAVALYRRSVEMGSPEAMFMLGILYSQGRGVEENTDDPLNLWGQAAEAGLPIAAQRLGDIYFDNASLAGGRSASETKFHGVQVKQDYVEALKWYKIAAEQGLDHSATRIAEIYEQGLGVKPDYAEAAKWYERAIDNTNTNAAYRLGLLNLKGLGVPQNYAVAARLFRRAASGGVEHLKARIELAKLHAQKGEQQNYGEAWFWFALGTAKDDKSNDELKADILTHLSAEEIATVDLRVKQWRDQEMAQIFNHPH